MKKIINLFFIVLISVIIIAPEVKANDENDIIANITDDSKIVKLNGSVFVEINVDNIENIKSVIGYISALNSEQYIEVELENSTQGKWYYFNIPSTIIEGQTYIMPKIKVVYKDGTEIIGKTTGEFKLLKDEDYSKIIGNIMDDSKVIEPNKSVFVEINVDNIENIKSVIGYISVLNSKQYIEVELKNSTQGKWYYFDMPATTIERQTYIMPKIKVIYKDGNIITGRIDGEFKIIKSTEESNLKKDSTMAKNILPNTGKKSIMWGMVILGIFIIIIGIINIKYKEVK